MKFQYTLFVIFVIILLAVPPFGLVLSNDKFVLENENIDNSPILKRDVDVTTTNAASDTFSTETTLPSTSITSGDSTATTTIITTTTSDSTITTTNVTESTAPTTTASTSLPPTATTANDSSTTLVTTTTVNTNTTTNDSSTASVTTTTPTILPTTAAPSGRKFDGLSFLGGIILAVGLGALIYLVIRYLRHTNRLPYSNLR